MGRLATIRLCRNRFADKQGVRNLFPLTAVQLPPAPVKLVRTMVLGLTPPFACLLSFGVLFCFAVLLLLHFVLFVFKLDGRVEEMW